MSQRFKDATVKWFWILVIYSSPVWVSVKCVTVKNPPKNPTTIEAQAKFFQDFFSVQLSPHNIEFGHVCEDPETWEQRYEKKDFKNHRDMGKVRWGDKQGGYGEHYWDLNHAGHTGDHDGGYEGNSDDGSYREEYKNDAYEEPSEYSPNYDDGYDPEKAAKYDDTNRAKRAHPRTRHSKKNYKVHDDDYEIYQPTSATNKKVRGEPIHREKPTDQNLYKKTVTSKRHKSYDRDDDYSDESDENEQESEEDKNENRDQFVLVLSHKDKGDQDKTKHKTSNSKDGHQYTVQNTQQFASRAPQQFDVQHTTVDNPQQFTIQNTHQYSNPNTEQLASENTQQFASENTQQLPPQNTPSFIPKKAQEFAPQNSASFVPYEGGAGLRHHDQQFSPAAATARLFLEPSTGHIIDRATGRAYVLQPLTATNYE